MGVKKSHGHFLTVRQRKIKRERRQLDGRRARQISRLGPSAGAPDDATRTRVPVVFDGSLVGELWADGRPDRSVLEDVASRIAPLVLIGWDTGGEAWEP